MIEILVVCGDTHCGSTRGLMMPEFSPLEEPTQIIKANNAQLWLYEKWELGWSWVNKYIGNDPWAFCFTGDPIEGLHHSRAELVSNDKKDHCDIFEQCLAPHIESAARRFFVLGTATHTGNSDEIALGKKLKGQRHPDTKRYAESRWPLMVKGFPLLLRHHITVTSRNYLRGTGLSVELDNEIISAVRHKHKIIPRGLICGHRHMYDLYTDNNVFSLVNGPWQLTTRYGHTKWSSMVPEPSLTILDWRDKKKGDCPEIVTYKFTPEGEKWVSL